MATARPLDLAKGTFKGFVDDEATWKAAALAYYTVFALAPLLVILLQIASLIWDPVEVRRSITGEFGTLMGREVGRQIETMVASAEERASGTRVRLILSLAGLAFGATGAFVSLRIYYAFVIVLLGAEFTQAWVRQQGRVIEPEDGAVRVIERKSHVGPSGVEEPDPRSRKGDDHPAADGLRMGRPVTGAEQSDRARST